MDMTQDYHGRQVRGRVKETFDGGDADITHRCQLLNYGEDKATVLVEDQYRLHVAPYGYNAVTIPGTDMHWIVTFEDQTGRVIRNKFDQDGIKEEHRLVKVA